MSKLTPCPFCNSEVSFCTDDDCDNVNCHLIDCDKCGTFHADVDPECETIEQARDQAAQIWNARAALDAEPTDAMKLAGLVQMYNCKPDTPLSAFAVVESRKLIEIYKAMLSAREAE